MGVKAVSADFTHNFHLHLIQSNEKNYAQNFKVPSLKTRIAREKLGPQQRQKIRKPCDLLLQIVPPEFHRIYPDTLVGDCVVQRCNGCQQVEAVVVALQLCNVALQLRDEVAVQRGNGLEPCAQD